MKKKEHIIFDSFKVNEGENEYWYEDEMANLDKKTDGNLIAIADMGLWDGRHSGYKVLENNLNQILKSYGCDDIVVEMKGNDIVCDAYHHDGVHHITYREIKDENTIDILLNKIYDGEHTKEDIRKYTKPIGHYVKKIYGW